MNSDVHDIVSLLLRGGVDNAQKAWELAEEIAGKDAEKLLDEALDLAGLQPSER